VSISQRWKPGWIVEFLHQLTSLPSSFVSLHTSFSIDLIGVFTPQVAFATMSDQAEWTTTRSSEIENIDHPVKGGVEGSIAQTFVPVGTLQQIRRQVLPELERRLGLTTVV
jgi:hypothetical protein